MTALLLETRLDPEQREFTETIRAGGDSLLAIINDILDYSKIEAGRVELELRPFDLRSCLHEAADVVALRAAEKRLELVVACTPDLPTELVGDPTRVRQVLVNLLSNAVKFTERGEVVVTAGLVSGREDAAMVHVQVRDTGIGIAPDHIDRLFQPFIQADASTTRRYGGTGLGLAVSRRFAELMGGTLRAESTEGMGSTFHFTFPARLSSQPEKSPEPASEMPMLASGVRSAILIVEDNAAVRELLSGAVAAWGMEPYAVESASAALTWIAARRDVAAGIVDRTLGGTDGLDLGAALERLHGRELPLVLLDSVSSGATTSVAAAIAGFHAVVTKPVRHDRLREALESVLDATPRRAPRAPQAPRVPRPDLPPLRVLLAEDNIVNQKVALAMLARLGYAADVADSGHQALVALEGAVYDLVLMDVHMPEMDGLEATRRIRAHLAAERQPRIVAMTANAMDVDRIACRDAGMDDFLAKPVRLESLADALARCRPIAPLGSLHPETQARVEPPSV